MTIKCAKCKRLLDGEIKGGILYVEFCPSCEQKIASEVYKKGYADCLKEQD